MKLYFGGKFSHELLHLEGIDQQRRNYIVVYPIKQTMTVIYIQLCIWAAVPLSHIFHRNVKLSKYFICRALSAKPCPSRTYVYRTLVLYTYFRHIAGTLHILLSSVTRLLYFIYSFSLCLSRTTFWTFSHFFRIL